ncbi:MAG: hypothetical protein Q4Q58_03405 [Thermoplasmata archaeon]|nr:hypothetical protein [Thermoplasmata archaeon]
MNGKRCRTLVVAHGKSEMMICSKIAAIAGIGIEIDSNDMGRETIAISGLQSRFESKTYSSELALSREFDRLEYFGRKKMDQRMPNLRIFTVMDIDGDRESMLRYTTGEMFKEFPLGRYVTPIYNDRNLDEVMEAIGYGSVVSKKVKTYRQICDGITDLVDLYRRLKENENTNMEEFVLHCLNHGPSYQGYLDQL